MRLALVSGTSSGSAEAISLLKLIKPNTENHMHTPISYNKIYKISDQPDEEMCEEEVISDERKEGRKDG